MAEPGQKLDGNQSLWPEIEDCAVVYRMPKRTLPRFFSVKLIFLENAHE